MAILKKLKDTLKEVGTLGYADTETFNPENITRNTLENAQGVSMASRDKPYNPAMLDPYTTGKKDTFGKTTAYYTPAIENKLLGDKSTVSRARLDVISPVLTGKQDNIREEEKNITLYRDLKAKGAITPEDDQELLDMKNQGISKADAAAKLIAKKRYQIGTRQSAPRTISEKNYTDIFNKSEIKGYLDEKVKNASPEVVEYMKQVAEEKGGAKARADIFTKFIERDIEEEAYNNKNFIEKSAENVLKTAGVAGLALANDIIFRLPAFALDITGQKDGDILNKLADKNIKKGSEKMGVYTGGVDEADTTYQAGQVVAAILPFLTPKGWIQAGAGVVSKLPGLSKFPGFVNSLSNLTKVVRGEKSLKSAEGVIRALGASAIRNGLFSVGGHALYEGKAPSAGQGALETGIGMAADVVIPGAGKALNYLGAKVGVGGLLKFGARKRLARELADEGEVGNMENMYKWLADRKQNFGNEEDMVAGLTQYTEDSYKAINDITKKMDDAGVRIQDGGYLSGSLKKLQKKLSGGESPEQIAKLSRVDELLAKVEKEGSLLPSEANEVKRLLDQNLDMFTMDGFIKKPQQDNVNLRRGIREAIEKEGDKLGFDVKAMNAETSVSRKWRDGILDKMLSDNIVERAALFTGKNIIRGALGGVVGPFEDWRANALFGMVGGLVAKPIIENQRVKNWFARTLTAFSKKEMGALEQFFKNGKTTPQAEEAILKFTEKLRSEQKAVYDEMINNRKLLPPPSGKPVSPSEVDIAPQTGYSPGVMDKNNEALYGTNQMGTTPTVQSPKNIIESIKQPEKTPVKTTGLLDSLGKSEKQGVGQSNIPGKKVNNSIIQKLKEKKNNIVEGLKKAKVDTELESLQKIQESMPGVPSIEVPKDYTPIGGLPTGTEFEAPIISSISKTKGKLPSPDVKRPQIRGFDLSTRSSMLESLKEQGMFTDSFFVVKDKNVSNKLFEYAEKKAIKKGNPTSGTKVDMKALVERAENGADTLLTPKEYMKLGKENGVYLRMDIGNGNQVAVNASYADIFFKNFDDVTFKGNNELSPVVVLSKGEPVGVIMPIKDVYSLKGKLGDFSMQSKTPQVEGKTATGVLKDWKPTKGGYSMDNIDIKNTNAFPRSQYHRPEYINSDSYKYWLEQAKQGKEIPPIVVEKKGDGYHILDGYHRIAAAEDAGVKNIKALVLDTPIDKTGKPFTKFTDEELKNISKPKSSLPMSQKLEVKYSKKDIADGKYNPKDIYKDYTENYMHSDKWKGKSKAIVIDSDSIKKMFNEYDPKNPGLVHEESSNLSKEFFDRAVAENPDAPVIFSAGGPASGKSEGIINGYHGEKNVIFDTVLGDFEAFLKKAKSKIKDGKVKVHAIYTDIDTAKKYNAGRDRSVPESLLESKHKGFRKAMDDLIKSKEYKEGKIAVEIRANKGGSTEQIPTNGIEDFIREHKNRLDIK